MAEFFATTLDTFAPVTAWLLTYLMHSTVLLLTALVVVRIGHRLGDAAQEAVWRIALFGGVITATLALSAPQLGAAWQLTTGRAVESSHTVSAPPITPDFGTLEWGMFAYDLAPLLNDGSIAPGSLLRESAALNPPAAGEAGRGSAAMQPVVHVSWVAILAIIGLVLGVASISLAQRKLNRRLQHRQRIDSGRVRCMLDDLCNLARARTRIRLTWSTRINVPIAFGVLRREVCLPNRVVTDMPASRQRMVLAHELAHLLRWDPAWQALYRMMEWVLFIQPLNRIASRRLLELAEFQCDEWAVAQTGEPFNFARCLTEVAGWLVPASASMRHLNAAAMTTTMARSKSNIRVRIERVLDDPDRVDRRQTSRAWRSRVLIGTLAAPVVAGVLAVSPRVEAVASEETEPAAVASQWPELNLAEVATLQEAVTSLDEEIRLLDVEIHQLAQRLIEFDPELKSDTLAIISRRLNTLREARRLLTARLPDESVGHNTTRTMEHQSSKEAAS